MIDNEQRELSARGRWSRIRVPTSVVRPQQPFNMHQVNDGNVAYTRRTALKVIERQVYDFANSPYRSQAALHNGLLSSALLVDRHHVALIQCQRCRRSLDIDRLVPHDMLVFDFRVTEYPITTGGQVWASRLAIGI